MFWDVLHALMGSGLIIDKSHYPYKFSNRYNYLNIKQSLNYETTNLFFQMILFNTPICFSKSSIC